MISAEKFGKDHWSTLAYVETCCVDNEGKLCHHRMRTNENRHPLLKGGGPRMRTMPWEDGYSTRLRGYWREDDSIDKTKMVLGHDDWDCLDDLDVAGLVEIISLVNGFVKMTDLGLQIAGKIRDHKANGGHFATFVMPKLEVAKSV